MQYLCCLIDRHVFDILRKTKNNKYSREFKQEDIYKTVDDLITAIADYIYYYNYDRIKVKLKGLSPVNYRLQSSN